MLIHGGAIDHRMWDELFVELAGRFRVIRYDVRGCGLSRSPYGTYCNYEDLGRLLRELDAPRVHLVGLSLGCRIAADLAIAEPASVASLVLAAPGISGCTFDSPEVQDYLTRIRAALTSGDFAQAAEEFVRGWTDGPRRSPDQVPAAVRERVKAMALQTVRPDRDLGRGRELDPPAIGRLTEIRIPTLAVLGALDMPDIRTIVEAVERDVAGARVEVFPDAAHMVNLERARDFNALVLTFLEEHTDR